jgi:hypothetical protein
MNTLLRWEDEEVVKEKRIRQSEVVQERQQNNTS